MTVAFKAKVEHTFLFLSVFKSRQKPTLIPYSCHAQFGKSGSIGTFIGGGKIFLGCANSGSHTSRFTITHKIIFLLSFLAWLSSRSLKLSIGTAISFFVIGYFGMWKDTMSTMAIISVATLICLIIGTPIGVLMARSERLKNILSPVLDMMQTIPTFVYLIPIIMLLGIGKVPGLLAVCVYAIPPIVRLTNLGIREVDRRVVEAAKALGIKKRIILFKIEIPLALPSIMTGVNQTIMMALAMVVIASMIGVSGLGVPILRSISNQFLALGLMNGLAIVALAIIFDRISQNYARRIQKHKEAKK